MAPWKKSRVAWGAARAVLLVARWIRNSSYMRTTESLSTTKRTDRAQSFQRKAPVGKVVSGWRFRPRRYNVPASGGRQSAVENAPHGARAFPADETRSVQSIWALSCARASRPKSWNARHTFDEEEFLANVREIEATGGLHLDDFIAEVEARVRSR